MNVTIIIATYNRPAHLRRALAYYESVQCPFPIIVADSSNDNSAGAQIVQETRGITVQHIPFSSNVFLYQKLARAAEATKTPYVVFCADDDFIVPSAIASCASFLDVHVDYVAAHGLAITVRLDERIKIHLHELAAAEERDATERLRNRLRSFRPSLYAVHRREVFVSISEACTEEIGLRFSELLSASLATINGKIAVLPELYMVRESHAGSDSKTQPKWVDAIVDPRFSERYKRVRFSLASALANHTTSPDEGLRVVDESFKFYLYRIFWRRQGLSARGASLRERYMCLRIISLHARAYAPIRALIHDRNLSEKSLA